MQDHDSVKNELQTLIMLEQQQASALHSINNKAGFGGMPVGGQFGFPGAGLYGPISYGGLGSNNFGSTGFYKAGGDLYDRAVSGVINSVNNVNANMRNFAMTANLDSASPMWLNQSKLSAEARQLAVSRGGEKLASGTMSAISGAVGVGTTLLAGGITGALGGAAIGAVVDIGADQVKQNYAYDQYLTQNAYRFINMMESNNKRGVGGFSRSERWETANFLRHFNTEMKISDEDTMTILKGFTEGDLLRESKDVETFKDQMTKLTKSLKTMALTLNDSYEEVAELMATMKKKGIDSRNYEAYAAQSKIVGGLIGADASETMQYQLNMASSLTAGTMMSSDRMMGTVASAQAYMGKIYDEALAMKDADATQELRYNRIVNRGGIDAATSDYLSSTSGILRNNQIMGYYGASFFDWDGTTWKFNRSAFEQYTSGNMTMDQLQAISSQKLNGAGNAGIAQWQNIGSELLENSLSNVSDRASLIRGWVNAARATNPSMRNMGDAEVMKYVLGLSGEDSTFVADITSLISADGGAYYDKVISASVAQRFMDELNSNRVGAGYAMKNWWGGVKDTVGDFFSPIGNWWNSATEAVQDWYYGKEYYDVKKLWSDTDFSKGFGGQFDARYYSDLMKSLEELADSFEKTSPKLSSMMKGLSADVRALGTEAAFSNVSGTNAHGIGFYGWGNLTDYKAYMKDYSMWDKATGQGAFIGDIYTALNEAGSFGFEATYGNDFSASQRKAILNMSMLKYKDIMADPSNVSSEAIQFARAFEQYNLNINEMDGFYDAYSTGQWVNKDYYKTVNGIDGRLKELGINSDGGEDLSAKYESITATIDNYEKIEQSFKVAREKIGNRSGIFAQANVGDYGFVRNKNGTYEIVSHKSGLPVASGVSEDYYLGELEKLRGDSSLGRYKETIANYTAFASAYTAVAGITGMDDANRKQMIATLKGANTQEKRASAIADVNTMLRNHMFSTLPENAYVGTVDDLKASVLGLSWVKNMGGTQVVGNAFDAWASSNSVVNGSQLNAGLLGNLVDTIVEAATAGGDIKDAQKEEREISQAKDVYAIREMIAKKGIDDKHDYDADYNKIRGNSINIPDGEANPGKGA